MRIFAFFAACLLCNPASPETIPSLRPVGQLPLEAVEVQFVSASVGWCRTTNGFHNTVDGGKTWVRVLAPTSGDDTVWQFQFLNSLTGWVRKSGGLFQWTHNGGKSWGEIDLPGADGGSRLLVEDSPFVTMNTGWMLGMQEVPGEPSKEPIRYRIAGDHSVYVPVLFRTNDGGRTWVKQRYPDLKGLPYRLTFADAEHGLSVEFNKTLFTRDGGESWRVSRYCANVNTKDLRAAELGTGTFEATTAQLLDPQYGWWSVEGDLFRTTDGGATWCCLPSIRWDGHDLAIHDIRFANRRLGWAVPTRAEQRPRPTPCFQTLDGGLKWTAIQMPLETRIEGVTLAADGAVYCWGNDRLYALVK